MQKKNLKKKKQNKQKRIKNFFAVLFVLGQYFMREIESIEFSTRTPRQFNRKTIVFSTNGAGTTIATNKGIKLDPCLISYIKINSKLINT